MRSCWPPLVIALATLSASAQQAPAAAIARQTGTDPDSGIRYVLLSATGKSVALHDAAAAQTEPPNQAAQPQLVAQCSLTPAGKYVFEVLASVPGTLEPLVFAPPWHPQPGELFPPHLIPINVTMSFVGYTKYKPVRRVWDTLLEPAGWLRYSTPGMRSHNMEQIAFYLQVLRALPTLRLTLPDSSWIEFETTAWQQAVRAEPLCHASGL